MTWSPPRRSAEAEGVYAAAEADREANPRRYMLDVDAVTERATRGGELPVEGFAPGWRDGLRQFLGSAAQDGRLNAVGARVAVDSAVAKLRAEARIGAAIAADPARAHAPLAPPIVIVGGWRSGTTFLFRMLAGDARLHAPLPAELTQPWRTAGLTGAGLDAVVASNAAAHDLLHLLNPTLRAVHDSGPRLAEECVLGMGTDLRNWGLSATMRLDAYSRWLAHEDLAGTYRRYRRLLQLAHGTDGRRLLLKAPAHTAELDHLAAAFPGVVVVHLHRDVAETVASGASLFAVYRSTYSDDVDPVDVGRFLADQTELWLRRAATARATPDIAATFLDVDYTDLVRSPATVAAAVYTAAGMDPPADVAALVDAYAHAHPRGEYGRHTYSASEFGLDPAELRDRFGAIT